MFIAKSFRSEFEVTLVAGDVFLLRFVFFNDVLVEKLLPRENTWTQGAYNRRNRTLRELQMSQLQDEKRAQGLLVQT